MDGSVMRKLAEALLNEGFVIKKIEEESYSQFDRPSGGEKYTGEIVIKIRPAKDEEADAGKRRAREERAGARYEPPAPEAAPVSVEVSF